MSVASWGVAVAQGQHDDLVGLGMERGDDAARETDGGVVEARMGHRHIDRLGNGAAGVERIGGDLYESGAGLELDAADVVDCLVDVDDFRASFFGVGAELAEPDLSARLDGRFEGGVAVGVESGELNDQGLGRSVEFFGMPLPFDGIGYVEFQALGNVEHYRGGCQCDHLSPRLGGLLEESHRRERRCDFAVAAVVGADNHDLGLARVDGRRAFIQYIAQRAADNH